MPGHQAPLQPTKGGYRNGSGGNVAQGMGEMVLRDPQADEPHDLRSNGQANQGIKNPPSGRPPYAAEMLQKGPVHPQHDPSKPPSQLWKPKEFQKLPVYDEWENLEFLPLRMKDLPPRKPPPPAAAPFGAQRYSSEVPSAKQQHLPPNVGPRQIKISQSALHAAPRPTETIQIGSETYRIISTLQKAKPEDAGMSLGVYRMSDRQGKNLVVKKLSLASESKKARALAEMQALQRVKSAVRTSHENINAMIAACMPENARQGVLVLEYCAGGSLQNGVESIRRNRGRLDVDLAYHFFYGIAKGLVMIHHGISDHTDIKTTIKGWQTICHLDIKPANILLSHDPAPGKDRARYPRIVIADFGCSVTAEEIYHGKESKVVQEYGTPGWLPPEAPSYVSRDMVGRYGKPTDIWQAGGVVQCMVRLLDQPDMTRLEKPLWRKYGPELNCLVATCMKVDLTRRPTAVDLCRELRMLMVRKGIPV